MSVVFDRPYEFVPPHRGTWWPWWVQRLRLVDIYLRKKHGIVSFECRGIDKLKASASAGDGIILAPNHSRYSDPLAMGWPARLAGLNFFAMASWHLFNKSWFDAFSMRKCGGFSLYREGTDRKSIETAINILATAERPLILFPEGMTFRTNDWVRPLLDGVTFVARSAARKRAKKDDGRVVAHPVAIKYTCPIDMTSWASEQIEQLESHLNISPITGFAPRLLQIAESRLGGIEAEHFGDRRDGDTQKRQNDLVVHLLTRTENRLGLSPDDPTDIGDRVRAIRTRVASDYFQLSDDSPERDLLRSDSDTANLAYDLYAYPDSYLQDDGITDMRVIESVQRLQVSLLGKANRKIPLHCILEVGDSVEVPPEKAPRGQQDPVLALIRQRLTEMIDRLATEARPLSES